MQVAGRLADRMSVEEHLRAVIADGDYEIDPQAVAQAMIDKVLVVLPPVQPLAPEHDQAFPRLDAA